MSDTEPRHDDETVTEAPPAARILLTADNIVHGSRRDDYGGPVDHFTRVGRMWGATLGVPDIAPHTVTLMLAQLKIARAANDPSGIDSYVDIAGYAALGAETAIDDITAALGFSADDTTCSTCWGAGVLVGQRGPCAACQGTGEVR